MTGKRLPPCSGGRRPPLRMSSQLPWKARPKTSKRNHPVLQLDMNSLLSMATDGSEIVPLPTTGVEEPSPPNSTKSKTPTPKRKRPEKKSVKPLKSTTRSWVWDHFERFEKAIYEIIDGKQQQVGLEQRAKCKYCLTDLACDSFNGTSALKRHIENVCKLYPGRIDLEEGQQVFTSDGAAKPMVGMVPWTQEGCVKAAAEMIVLDELPFSHIEKEGFRRFCSVAVPLFEIPSRRLIVKTFLKLYDEKKEQLRLELSNHRVCLTADTWTSIQNVNYMVLTAHFIDYRWNMHKRILNFCIIPNHRGTTIGKILEMCLIQWMIDKVLTVSVDNAAANKGAIDYLRKKLVNWTTPPVLGGKHLHVRCLSHILNLIVRSGLNIMDKSVASIRNAVKYVRSSPSRLDDFKLCVEKERLDCKKVCALDVPTRWNSTFLMLETALELKRAFERMAEEEEQQYYGYFNEDEDEDEHEEDEENLEGIKIIKPRKRIGPPNEADWDMTAVFVKFLRVLYDVTMKISASTNPTAQSTFHDIVAIDAEISGLFGMPEMSNGSENEKIMVQMAVKMRSKFKKYFGMIDDLNQLLLVALVLDPRYKMRNFKHVCQRMLGFDDQQVKEKSSQLKDLLVALTGLYASSAGSQNTQRSRGNNGGNNSGTSSSKAKSTSVGGMMAEMLDDWERELEDSREVVVESEVDRYLLDPIEKPPRGANFCILLWWKLNGAKYPNLQAVARDVLAIQVSTVASGSCFSTGKRVIDPYRSSLTPRSVEALICLQNWIRSEGVQAIEYFPTIEEMEFYEGVETEYAREEKLKKL